MLLLFSDAEVFEDVGEDGVGGDFAAGDFGKVVEALAEVFGNEVAGDVVGYGMTDTGNGFEGVMEGFVMTDVSDDGGVVALIDGKVKFERKGRDKKQCSVYSA